MGKVAQWQIQNFTQRFYRQRTKSTFSTVTKPEDSFETADALIFLVKDAAMALDCRNELLKFKISTKILPEAMSWHFAKQWKHIPEIHNIKGKNNYSESEEILSRCVSIPIFVNMPSDMPAKIKNAIESVAIKI